MLAARILPQVVFLLAGGVWADRLPRHVVMVAANIVSGASQVAIAVLLLTHSAEIWHLLGLQAVSGVSAAFFFPASTAIVPQTVSPARLQQANALLRLSVNATQIGGAAVGGLLVAGFGPGWTIAMDAATYFVSAALLAPMRLPRAVERAVSGQSFLRELLDGWVEFRTRTWVWVLVVEFAFLNAFANGSFAVLGPVVAKASLGGAHAWGLILTGQAVGLVLGGALGLRYRPERPMLAASLSMIPLALPFVLLAFEAPTLLIAASAVAGGIGIEVFGVLWDTSLQQHVPPDRLSRVSSYDALGSFALMPLGLLVVGPIADAVGVKEELLGVAGLIGALSLAVVCVPSVRNLRRV